MLGSCEPYTAKGLIIVHVYVCAFAYAGVKLCVPLGVHVYAHGCVYVHACMSEL